MNKFKNTYKSTAQLIFDGFSTIEAAYLNKELDLWLVSNNIEVQDGLFYATEEQLDDYAMSLNPDIVDFGFINVTAMLDSEYPEG